MKKLTAILLLAIFFVNLIGYRAWFYVAEQRWNKQVEISLDQSSYNESELVTIRVPLNLPYVPDTKTFRRTQGEVKVNGHIYRYVKSKVENGEYVLLCLPDNYKQRLQNARQHYTKFANDIEPNTDANKSGSTAIIKLLPAEYDNWQVSFLTFPSRASEANYCTMQDKRNTHFPHLSPAQPPDLS